MNHKFYDRLFAFTAAMGYLFIFFTGIFLDCLTLLPLFAEVSQEQIPFREIMLGHAAANLLMAFALYRLLPKVYRINALNAYLFCFVIGFFIPILGNIGLLSAFLFGLREDKDRDQDDKIWQVTGQAPMPNQSPNMNVKSKFGMHGMQGRLRKSENANEHLDIVLATRFMRDENAVPLLSTALKNPNDDVRLLAFSFLEKKNVTINQNIERLQQSLDNEDRKKAKIHVAIAQNYLRLVLLELIQEEIKKQALTKARQHLDKALAEDAHDRTAHFVLGRVLLEQGEIEQAESSFAMALELGFAAGDVYPFLAKTAYLRRQFHMIPEYLGKIPVDQRIYPPFADIAAFWLRDGSSPLHQQSNLAV